MKQQINVEFQNAMQKTKKELSPEKNVAFCLLPSVSIWKNFIRAPHRNPSIDARRCYDQNVENSDTSDGRNLMPEPSQNADPAVTAEQSESSQTVDNIDSASTDNSNTCEKSADPVG